MLNALPTDGGLRYGPPPDKSRAKPKPSVAFGASVCVVGRSYEPSLTLVFGCLAAAALLMKRPVIAERLLPPEDPPLPLDSLTVVLGDRLPCAAVTYRPLIAER